MTNEQIDADIKECEGHRVAVNSWEYVSALRALKAANKRLTEMEVQLAKLVGAALRNVLDASDKQVSPSDQTPTPNLSGAPAHVRVPK